MTNFLVHRFVKDWDQTTDPAVRRRYGVFSGCVGIFLNICLCAAKFLAGFLTSSIARSEERRVGKECAA